MSAGNEQPGAQEMNNLSDIIDGRGQEELVEILADDENGDESES